MKPPFPGPAVLLYLGAALVLAFGFHRLGLWWGDELKTRQVHSQTQAEIGQIKSVTGKVLVRHFGEDRGTWIEAEKGQSHTIRSLDSIQVEARSSAQLILNSGYELNLEPNSLIVVELWNSQTNTSPIYTHVLQGGFLTTKKGIRGRTFVLKDGFLSYPEGVPLAKARELVVHNLHQAASTSETEPETVGGPTVPVVTEASSLQLAEGSLSDEYLDQVMGGQREQFQRCQANSLREGAPSKGRLVMGLKILNSGQIEEVQVLANDTANPELEKCVRDVMSRVKFKAFSGAPIARSYPLVFE